jgi:GH24 family phage-related lysozyme (muramidase)
MSDAPTIPNDKQHKGLTREQLKSLEADYKLGAEDHGWTVGFNEIDEGGGTWTLEVVYKRPGSSAAPAKPSGGGAGGHATDGSVEAAFEALMAEREGRRKDVYLDSLGKPTVGIGHLIVAADHLKMGDTITDAQIDDLFTQDSADALSAARSQAADAGITDLTFIPYLASVNFQLGTLWTKTFPNTWKMILDGKYEEAADGLDGTKWAQQTPVRVRDFQVALRRLPPKP